MLKKILKVLKKVILAVFLIYSYNLIAAPLNLIVPINLITVSFISILGLPALLSLIAIMIIVF